ncbi:hypothetical protein AVEN_166374-1 [Araneus ventricosus]|uniref:Uncharacterized protein n=1 Tax=Araneus ventricosus TaxID=182803 RepID=A0A4Y2SNL1_ARAVE|nr:hypothetical protein AVEN_166374-1 [Araneus ventricosus]
MWIRENSINGDFCGYKTWKLDNSVSPEIDAKLALWLWQLLYALQYGVDHPPHSRHGHGDGVSARYFRKAEVTTDPERWTRIGEDTYGVGRCTL